MVIYSELRSPRPRQHSADSLRKRLNNNKKNNEHFGAIYMFPYVSLDKLSYAHRRLVVNLDFQNLTIKYSVALLSICLLNAYGESELSKD